MAMGVQSPELLMSKFSKSRGSRRGLEESARRARCPRTSFLTFNPLAFPIPWSQPAENIIPVVMAGVLGIYGLVSEGQGAKRRARRLRAKC